MLFMIIIFLLRNINNIHAFFLSQNTENKTIDTESKHSRIYLEIQCASLLFTKSVISM